MTGFDVYKLYVALKNHFNSDTYDFFKYGGKTRASVNTFEARPDKYFFHKLAKRKDVERFILANIVDGGSGVWVGEMANEQMADERYRAWLKRQESLTYVFTNDLDKLNEEYNSNILVSQDSHPPLLKLYLQKQISIETIIILNDMCKFFRYWNKHIEEQVVWPGIYKQCKKYKPFIQYDMDKLKKIVVDKFQIIK